MQLLDKAVIGWCSQWMVQQMDGAANGWCSGRDLLHISVELREEKEDPS